MGLHISSIAPDFSAESSRRNHQVPRLPRQRLGVLFSHPKDFTPVCTTELGYAAKRKADFDRRNVKVIALSVDPVDSHRGWISDIEETQGAKMNYPIIADSDRKVSGLYDYDPSRSERHVHGSFRLLHRSEQEDPRDDHVSGEHRPQLRRDPACGTPLQLTDGYSVAIP